MMSLLELDVLHAVGWALLHFLWQGTIIALLVVLLMKAFSGARASTRYVAAAAGLFVSPLVFITTAARHADSGPLATLYGEAITATQSTPDRAIAVAAVIWLAVVSVLTVRLVLSWRQTVRILRATERVSIADTLLAECLSRARARMGMTKRVELRSTLEGHTPAVVGWLRAIVFVPASILTGLSPDQVELLLAHELAHVRRHDYIVNILQSWTETLFFFHPGIRWVSARMRIERELACDEAVVAAYARPDDYGEALARLALIGGPAPGIAVGAAGSPLQVRIRKLFGLERAADVLLPRWALAAALPGLVLAVLAGGQLAAAQSAISGMIDAGAESGILRVIARHEHRNAQWSRSVLVKMAARDGGEVHELRLGNRLRGIRYSAVIADDSTVTRLRAELIDWRGKRVVELLPARASSQDSLVMTFLRESGVGGSSRARQITSRNGVAGLVEEIRQIGDPVVRASYLESALSALSVADDRVTVVEQALTIPNAPVETGKVFLTALTHAASDHEVAAIVERSSRIRGEAEQVEVLRAAVRRSSAPLVHAAVNVAMNAIPSDEARGVVRSAMADTLRGPTLR